MRPSRCSSASSWPGEAASNSTNHACQRGCLLNATELRQTAASPCRSHESVQPSSGVVVRDSGPLQRGRKILGVTVRLCMQ